MKPKKSLIDSLIYSGLFCFLSSSLLFSYSEYIFCALPVQAELEKALPAKSSELNKVSPEKSQKLSKEPGAGELTYAGDISAILINKCASCHQTGGIAPFALTSYEDLKKRASTIDAVVASGYMPPWKPAPNYGSFMNSRSLSMSELAKLREWISKGLKPGNLADAQQLKQEPPHEKAIWRSGKPDLILRMPEPFKVPADGPDLYRCFVFPLNNEDARFVSHVEFHPGNAKVVHHALFFLDSLGEARKKDRQDSQPGFASFGGPGFLPTGGLGGWAPGNTMLPLPDGVSRLVRKNSDLVVQLHMHPDGKEELAQAELGIYFSKKTPEKLLLPLTVRSRKIDIAPGEKNYELKASTTVPNDFELLQVAPHAHLLCKEIECHAITPDAKEIPLIWIKSWDFNWQEQYAYEKPIHLPKGTVLSARFVYDNSDANFRNPNNPPKRVKWGEQTTDEMAILFFSGVVSKNDEMTAYMRSMLLGAVKEMPALGLNPGQAFNAARLIFSKENDLGKILQESRSKKQVNQDEATLGRKKAGVTLK